MKPPGPKLSVIIVGYNTREPLERCLQTLRDVNVSFGMEIIVVDNQSPDDSLVMLKSFEDWPALRVIANEVNVGFASACNQAARYATGEHLLFLNPDTVANKPCLEAMAGYLDSHPEVAVVGPGLTGTDGKLQESCGGSWSPAYIAFSVFLPRRISTGLYARKCRDRASRGAASVDWVLGACAAIRRNVFDTTGGFDPNFFLGAGDMADLCLRIRRLGHQVIYLGQVSMFHEGGASVKKTRPAMLLHLYRWQLYYSRKHYGKGWESALRVFFSAISLWKGLLASLLSIVAWRRYNQIAKAHLFAAFRLPALSIPSPGDRPHKT